MPEHSNLCLETKLKVQILQFFTSEMFSVKVVAVVFRGKVSRDPQGPGQRQKP